VGAELAELTKFSNDGGRCAFEKKLVLVTNSYGGGDQRRTLTVIRYYYLSLFKKFSLARQRLRPLPHRRPFVGATTLRRKSLLPDIQV